MTICEHWYGVAVAVCLTTAAVAAPPPPGVETNIYFTQFETNQNYNPAFELAGQNGWLMEGTGGNGLINNALGTNEAQSAYVGYWPPLVAGEYLTSIWKPIQLNPKQAGFGQVRFSALMSIIDSSTTNYDNFQWVVYNSKTNRLFTIDFDNYSWAVSYALDGTNTFTTTSVKFTNDVPYLFSITMNFASNRWSATLGGATIATNKLITTVGAELTLGEIDAAWQIYDPRKPGDNYMVFDNYRVAAQLPPQPGHMRIAITNAQPTIHLRGTPGARYALEATTNMLNWTALVTNQMTTNGFSYRDTAAPVTRRFYRSRLLP